MLPKNPKPTTGQRYMARAVATRIRIEEFLLSRLPQAEAEAVIAAMEKYAEATYLAGAL